MQSEPVVSRTTIFILSYILEKMGLSWQLEPTLAKNCVFIGTIGLIAYVAFEWTAARRAAARAAALELIRRQFVRNRQAVLQ